MIFCFHRQPRSQLNGIHFSQHEESGRGKEETKNKWEKASFFLLWTIKSAFLHISLWVQISTDGRKVIAAIAPVSTITTTTLLPDLWLVARMGKPITIHPFLQYFDWYSIQVIERKDKKSIVCRTQGKRKEAKVRMYFVAKLPSQKVE